MSANLQRKLQGQTTADRLKFCKVIAIICFLLLYEMTNIFQHFSSFAQIKSTKIFTCYISEQKCFFMVDLAYFCGYNINNQAESSVLILGNFYFAK